MPSEVLQESLVLFPAVILTALALTQQVPQSATTTPAPSAPVTTQTATLAPVTVTNSQVSDTTQVCRTEPVTGSRFGRRVCRSAIQTDEERAASREMLRQMQGARVPPSG